MSIPLPHGIIFDFDGVIVDTEWVIYQSWVRLYAREGQEISVQTYSPCLGAGYSRWNPADYLERLTGKTYDWDKETAERQAWLEAELARSGLMPGVRELMDFCHARRIGMTVASSSSRRWVAGWLQRLGIEQEFKGVFCRTDGYPVKPDPALFHAAQKCLGLPAQDCLIIEDSENGVRSARNAGIPCAAIPNRMTEVGDFSQATYRFDSLAELLGYLC
ncbi:MAG: HAD-IA family hydrolase [Akkermansia sp.]|nr:HAD-IA family hydrolase [Akkermansia sp.]